MVTVVVSSFFLESLIIDSASNLDDQGLLLHHSVSSLQELQKLAVKSVEGRMSSLRNSLIKVYLSQTDGNCWEAKAQWTEKMLWRGAVFQLILHIESKEEM